MRRYVVRAKVASGGAWSYAFTGERGAGYGAAHHWLHWALPDVPDWAARLERTDAEILARELSKGTDVRYRVKAAP